MPALYASPNRYHITDTISWEAAVSTTTLLSGGGYITSLLYAGDVETTGIFDVANTVKDDADYMIWHNDSAPSPADYPLRYSKVLLAVVLDGTGLVHQDKVYSSGLVRGGVDPGAPDTELKLVVRDTRDYNRPLAGIALNSKISTELTDAITSGEPVTLKYELINGEFLSVSMIINYKVSVIGICFVNLSRGIYSQYQDGTYYAVGPNSANVFQSVVPAFTVDEVNVDSSSINTSFQVSGTIFNSLTMADGVFGDETPNQSISNVNMLDDAKFIEFDDISHVSVDVDISCIDGDSCNTPTYKTRDILGDDIEAVLSPALYTFSLSNLPSDQIGECITIDPTYTQFDGSVYSPIVTVTGGSGFTNFSSDIVFTKSDCINRDIAFNKDVYDITPKDVFLKLLHGSVSFIDADGNPHVIIIGESEALDYTSEAIAPTLGNIGIQRHVGRYRSGAHIITIHFATKDCVCPDFTNPLPGPGSVSTTTTTTFGNPPGGGGGGGSGLNQPPGMENTNCDIPKCLVFPPELVTEPNKVLMDKINADWPSDRKWIVDIEDAELTKAAYPKDGLDSACTNHGYGSLGDFVKNLVTGQVELTYENKDKTDDVLVDKLPLADIINARQTTIQCTLTDTQFIITVYYHPKVRTSIEKTELILAYGAAEMQLIFEICEDCGCKNPKPCPPSMAIGGAGTCDEACIAFSEDAVLKIANPNPNIKNVLCDDGKFYSVTANMETVRSFLPKSSGFGCYPAKSLIEALQKSILINGKPDTTGKVKFICSSCSGDDYKSTLRVAFNVCCNLVAFYLDVNGPMCDCPPTTTPSPDEDYDKDPCCTTTKIGETTTTTTTKPGDGPYPTEPGGGPTTTTTTKPGDGPYPTEPGGGPTTTTTTTPDPCDCPEWRCCYDNIKDKANVPPPPWMGMSDAQFKELCEDMMKAEPTTQAAKDAKAWIDKYCDDIVATTPVGTTPSGPSPSTTPSGPSPSTTPLPPTPGPPSIPPTPEITTTPTPEITTTPTPEITTTPTPEITTTPTPEITTTPTPEITIPETWLCLEYDEHGHCTLWSADTPEPDNAPESWYCEFHDGEICTQWRVPSPH